MVHEIDKQKYRGVLCMSCRQPIPVPEIVLRLELHSDARASDLADEIRGHVFSLRCRACDREKPYRSADIVEFEGAPRRRGMQLRNPQGIGLHSRAMSKAANG